MITMKGADLLLADLLLLEPGEFLAGGAHDGIRGTDVGFAVSAGKKKNC